MSVRAFSTAVAVGYLVREFECSVKALNDLLKPAILGRNMIIIGKADNLNQVGIHIL